jgi:hypothetical protein
MFKFPTLVLGACVLAALLPCAARAQDYAAMLRQSLARQQQIVDAAQHRAAGVVRQRMQDPQVQTAYQEYATRMQQAGRQPVDFAAYTYQYVYTNGFSTAGIVQARANEAGIAQREAAAARGLRQAEENRALAMQAQQDGYSRNQQEAGRALLGQSTYGAPDGTARALPHTWQPNTTQVWQGNTYHVDASGNYYVRAVDGWWYPVTP